MPIIFPTIIILTPLGVTTWKEAVGREGEAGLQRLVLSPGNLKNSEHFEIKNRFFEGHALHD